MGYCPMGLLEQGHQSHQRRYDAPQPVAKRAGAVRPWHNSLDKSQTPSPRAKGDDTWAVAGQPRIFCCLVLARWSTLLQAKHALVQDNSLDIVGN